LIVADPRPSREKIPQKGKKIPFDKKKKDHHPLEDVIIPVR